MSDPIVFCPVCDGSVRECYLNQHIDSGCKQYLGKAASSSSNASKPKQSKQTTLFASSSQSEPSMKKRKLSNTPSLSSVAPPAIRPKSSNGSTEQNKPKISNILDSVKPLAERARPSSLQDYHGQNHLLAPGAMLRNLIDSDRISSMILWGGPGTGKTTLARIIANKTSSIFKELSATSLNTQDIRKTMDEALNVLKLTSRRTILFVDEIQRCNRAVQDLFLPHLESGVIVCIFATTENPSFRLQSALLSRCRVFTLNKLTVDACKTILCRAVDVFNSTHTTQPAIEVDDDLLHYLASACDGDARIGLSSLELALASISASPGTKLDTPQLRQALLKAHQVHDKSGDQHYDTISALHKSIRGSDVNAALYWLARCLEGGEDPLFVARRVVRAASEDVGGDQRALQLALAAYQATQLVGMPECDCILADAVVYLAEAPKSVRVYQAYNAAKACVKSERQYEVPLHIRNAPTGLMKTLGYGKEYLYEPSFAHPVHQTFLPPELQGTEFIKSKGKEMEGRTVDESLLKEWERVHGKWDGRKAIGL